MPCIREIPALNALARESNGLRVVSVTFEPRDVALQFSKARGLETSIVPDSQAFIDEIGIKVYPTLVLVSPEGRLMGARSSYDPANADDSGLAGMQAWIASLGARI